MQKLTLIRPDDWHIHLRDGEALKLTVPHVERQFHRAIIMPNLSPPVTNVAMAKAYKKRILSATAHKDRFQPLMTLYLTDQTSAQTIKEAAESEEVFAFKLYPAGATTNSDQGVQDLKSLYPILEKLEEHDLPLLIHGEVTDSEIDIFDREKEFITKHLIPITKRFTNLRIVLEHITTKEAVQLVKESHQHVAATITAHHLLYDRNAIFAGGIKPHFYCLPILKRQEHRKSLVEAATSGDAKFFLGTDSAPHTKNQKESSCGCAGIYTAPYAMELYAEVFAQQNRLENLEQFASINGANFYKLPINREQITLIKEPQKVPESFPFMGESVIPLKSGESLEWSLVNSHVK